MSEKEKLKGIKKLAKVVKKKKETVDKKESPKKCPGCCAQEEIMKILEKYGLDDSRFWDNAWYQQYIWGEEHDEHAEVFL